MAIEITWVFPLKTEIFHSYVNVYQRVPEKIERNWSAKEEDSTDSTDSTQNDCRFLEAKWSQDWREDSQYRLYRHIASQKMFPCRKEGTAGSAGSIGYNLTIFNIAMENGPFVDEETLLFKNCDFPISSIAPRWDPPAVSSWNYKPINYSHFPT